MFGKDKLDLLFFSFYIMLLRDKIQLRHNKMS